MTRDFIWRELRGRLWHTTHPARFQRILERGAIVPEPDIPESKRWKTAAGPEFYANVRTIGGVSLFDFDKFDPKIYTEKYPLSNWQEFIPYRREWQCAVWIEIDRTQAAAHFVSGADLVAWWKADGAYRHTVMPYIEAAYIGELPRTAFARAFIVRGGKDFCQSLALE